MNSNVNQANYESDENDENDPMTLNYTELSQHIEDLLNKVREKSTGLTIKKELSALEEYYERQTQIRSMHIQTLTCEIEELKTKNTELVKRVVSVRDKCLVRKFQSRFWMVMTGLSLFEVFFPRTMCYVTVRRFYPMMLELIYGTSTVALIYRGVLMTLVNYQTFVVLDGFKYIQKVKSLFS